MSNRVESAFGNYCPHCATPHDSFRLLQEHVRDEHGLHLRSNFGARNTKPDKRPRGTIPVDDDAIS